MTAILVLVLHGQTKPWERSPKQQTSGLAARKAGLRCTGIIMKIFLLYCEVQRSLLCTLRVKHTFSVMVCSKRRIQHEGKMRLTLSFGEDVPYDVHQWKLINDEQWQLQPTDSPPTPWIAIDPTEPASSKRNSRYPRFSKALAPLIVEMQEGETLYLPAG